MPFRVQEAELNSILFRTDSSIIMGSGHVMRCLTLADELKKKGCKTLFVSRDLPGQNFKEIESRGHCLKILPRPKDYFDVNINKNSYEEWMGVTQEYDAEEFKNVLIDEKFDWIVVDHYSLGQEWEKQMKNISEKILVFDDLVERKHECNLLLNHTNLPGIKKKYKGLVSNNTKLLLGPKYLLLSPIFLKTKKRKPNKNGIIKRIFIYYGSIDPSNETGKAIESLIIMDRREIIVDVVIGRNNVNMEKIKILVSKMKNAYLHVQLPYLAEIMAKADLALCAGGYTLWEQIFLGLPSLVTGIAENQVKPAIILDKKGCLIWLGLSENVFVDQIISKLQMLFEHPELLIKQSKMKMDLVDGLGVDRVVRKMMLL